MVHDRPWDGLISPYAISFGGRTGLPWSRRQRVCGSSSGEPCSKGGSHQPGKLLTFDVNNVSEIPAQFNPYSVFNVERPKMPHSALTITLEAVQSKRHHRESPAVKLSLDFGKLTSEVDITILDRLTHLINNDWGRSSSSCAGPGMTAGSAQLLADNFGHIDEAIKDEHGSRKLNLDLQIKIQHATLRVRFPVLDLRVDRPAQSHDWWRRNLHKEVLLLEAEAPEVTCLLVPDSPLEVAVQVFKIEAYLQEDINTDPILFGEVTVDDAKATPYDGPHFNWPRLVISVSKKLDSALETGEESDTSATSMDAIIEPGLLKKEPGPFSSKKSMYTHDDLSFTEKSSAPEIDEIVSPGDALELRQFRDDCLARTSLAIEITVPSVIAYMPSQDFLELLYNRFNNDLLMWEPQPPRSHTYASSMAPSSTSLGVMHMLQHQQGDPLVTSTDSYLSDSEDDESMHYSIYDRHGPSKIKSQSSVKLLNKMCFTLSIGNGRLLTVVPHHDAGSKNSDVHGEIMLTLKDGLLFAVNQYGGDPDLRYLCLQANNAHMYHNSCVMLAVQPGNLDHIRGGKIPKHLLSRIYRSDPGASNRVQSRAGWGPDTPDMLTLVVKTKMDTLNNVKNFTIALRVDGATLRHEMHNPGESWISQVIDLVDLKDFPILGYTLPKIMTEIHMHIENCCVDYRPIHLPIWSVLTIEHLSVCSNIIAESAFSQVRLSLDDTAMFLTQKHNKEVNLIDYICVAEMDHFKIWLQFCYDKSGKQKIPKSDLRFMVRELRLLTCADSARALMDLIQYFVRDGDLEDNFKEDEGEHTPTSMEDAMQALPQEEIVERHTPSSVVPVPTITPEQEASVVSALEDAMSDCPEPP
ncbi:autophagy-related protein 2-like protein a, partial [Plakobranchus ocellatus]